MQKEYFLFICIFKNKTMKKLLLIAICSLFVTTSCRKDDDEKKVDLIVGTWKLNKQVTQYGNGTSETENPNSCEAQSNFVFASDKNLLSNEYYSSGTSCVLDDTSGTYSYDETTKLLTLILDGDNNSVKVETLNSNELIISVEEGDLDGDGKTDKFLTYLKK